jgi:translation initiation factor IF-2
MAIGPVEYAVIAFPGNKFKGEIAPALGDLVDRGIIKILDLAFVTKDADGNTAAVEIEEADSAIQYAFEAIAAERGGLINADDLADVAAALEPNSSAALIIWEDVWLTEAAQAFQRADAIVIERRAVPYEIVQAAVDWAQENATATLT